MDTISAASKYPICRHIKTNGRRCQSPAVHRATFCHFHRTLHDAHTKGFPPPSALGYMSTANIKALLDAGEPLSEIAKAFPSPTHLTLPPLEDAESVQVAISLIFSDMANGRVCPERARPLLYALQLASYNFRTLALVQARDIAEPMAHNVVRSRQGNTLSAPSDDRDSPSLLLPAKAPKRRRPARPASEPVAPEPLAPEPLAAEPLTPEPLATEPLAPAAPHSQAVILSEADRAESRAVILSERSQSKDPDATRLASTPGKVSASNPACLPASPQLADISRAAVSSLAVTPQLANKPCTAIILVQPQSSYLSSLAATDDAAPSSLSTDNLQPATGNSVRQTQHYDDLSHNPNEMSMIASTPTAKPTQPLHLRTACPTRGRGSPLNSRLPSPQLPRPPNAKSNEISSLPVHRRFVPQRL